MKGSISGALSSPNALRGGSRNARTGGYTSCARLAQPDTPLQSYSDAIAYTYVEISAW